MQQTIDQAAFDDFESIVKLVKASTKTSALGQCERTFPNPSVIVQDLWEGSMFKVSVDETIAGVIAMNGEPAEGWSDVDWQFPSDRALSVHRLAVKPSFQGCGLATQLMLFAEEYAKQENYGAIRLDVFCRNQVATQLCSKLDYVKVGNVQHNEKHASFFCYEKVLSPVMEAVLAW